LLLPSDADPAVARKLDTTSSLAAATRRRFAPREILARRGEVTEEESTPGTAARPGIVGRFELPPLFEYRCVASFPRAAAGCGDQLAPGQGNGS